MLSLIRNVLLAVSVLVTGYGGAALAHHGWGWTSPEPFMLTGTITEIYIGNPHVTLEVEAEDGMWHVDLAPLMRTINAGFNEDAAKIGDTVVLYGHRSIDPAMRSMKAVRVVVNGRTYDVYADRLAPFV
jgi:hypothetical protein